MRGPRALFFDARTSDDVSARRKSPRRRLEKTFEPRAFEERWYRLWESEGRFQPAGPAGAPRYVMVIPPPNVTGRLHIGHALGRTLEDILARWTRMQGNRVLWVPGTDHAGIATQMVVERQLAEEGIDRKALGRETFVERVWAWKREAGGHDPRPAPAARLLARLDRASASRSTRISRARCAHAFVRLYAEGLIYRGRYVVNWCPRCGTAVSDLEVVTRGRGRQAVPHPVRRAGRRVRGRRRDDAARDDARRHGARDPSRTIRAPRSCTGRRAILPFVGRELPVIEDAILVDREFGTGVVKVTPAHDANDFATGQRHDLPAIVVIGPDGDA